MNTIRNHSKSKHTKEPSSRIMPGLANVKNRTVLSPVSRHHHFSRLLRREVPPLPACLVTSSNPLASPNPSARYNELTGKVKVILCVKQSASELASAYTDSLDNGALGTLLSPNHPLKTLSHRSASPQKRCLLIHGQRNQVTLNDPTPTRRRGSTLSKKVFSFDGIHNGTGRMMDLCLLALSDTIQAILRGQDGCVLTIGHKKTGKTASMLGSDQHAEGLGIIPCAISWLYRSLNHQKDILGTRFAIRVSAVELWGAEENFRDLLAGVAPSEESFSPCHHFQGNTSTEQSAGLSPAHHESQETAASRLSKQLSSQSEIRATTVERAAYLLDTALANRSRFTDDKSEGLSHMLFTLHVYQCRVESSEKGTNVYGGRTKLHLLDLSCGRYGHGSQPVSPSNGHSNSTDLRHQDDVRLKNLSISGMATVILALLTGQRHLPYRDSALTHLLKEALSGNQMQPCILAHVDSGAQYFKETEQIIQLVSKIGRLRRRRVGSSNATNSPALDRHQSQILSEETASSSVDNNSDSSSVHRAKRRLRGPRLGRSSYAHSIGSVSLDLDFSSSSEQSCDTAIYLGQERKNRGNPTNSQPFKLHLAKLGPRGTADGSVDVGAFSSGQVSETESPGQARSLRGRSKSSRSGDEESPAGSRLVKRVMPRTNATAWPRSIPTHLLKTTLKLSDETWIDGPEVALSNDADAEVRVHSGDSAGFPNGSDQGNRSEDTGRMTAGSSSYCPPVLNSSRSVDHEHNCETRALSDISEHTEETETVLDISAMRISPLNYGESSESSIIQTDLNNIQTENRSQFEQHSLKPVVREDFNRALSKIRADGNRSRSYSNETQQYAAKCTDASQTLAERLIESLKALTTAESQINPPRQSNPVCLAGCGEQTIVMDNFDTRDLTPQWRKREKTTPQTGFLPYATPRESNAQRSPKMTCNPPKTQDNAVVNDATLLRVAAWVNSIGNSSQIDILPNLTGDRIRQTTNHSPHIQQQANTALERMQYNASQHLVKPAVCTPSSILFSPKGTTHNAQNIQDYPTVHTPYFECFNPYLNDVASQHRAPAEVANGLSSPLTPRQHSFYQSPTEAACRIQTQFDTESSKVIPLSRSVSPATITEPLRKVQIADDMATVNGSEKRRSKRFRSMRFLTLPIFRNLRIRKPKKAKETSHPTDFQVPASNGLNKSVALPLCPGVPDFYRAQYQHVHHNSMGNTIPSSISTLHNSSIINQSCTPTSVLKDSSGFPTPIRWERLPPYLVARQSDRLHCSSPISQYSQTRLNYFGQKMHSDFPSPLFPQTGVYRSDSTNVENSVDMTVNAGVDVMGSFSYTNGLITSASRSRRRSLTGGAASSGYESMRIGTSDLSLSHPDSASECSGRMGNSLLTKDGYKFPDSTKCHKMGYRESGNCSERTAHMNSTFVGMQSPKT